MSIELTRVDFRLIHGQVITRWLTQCQINEIVTIDNELAKDLFMQEVFKMAAPKGVKITIVDDVTAVKKQEAGDFDKKRVMVLFKGVNQLNKAVEAGLKLDKVQIGGLGGGMVYNQDLVNQITDTCSFIAPVSAYPGEFEMEAMAAGAIRVLNGEEELKQYTGKLCWNGFEWD